MNTRFLKQAFVLLLCSLFFAGTALWLVSVKEPRSYGGEPVFAKTLQNLDNLGRLTIETPKTVVNLQLEDNLWRVMEIGNYYAGYRQINNLFNDFADARIYRRRGPATDADEKKFGLDDNAFRVITRDAGGQILNSVLIGKAAADNLYHFARIEGEKDVFSHYRKLQLSRNCRLLAATTAAFPVARRYPQPQNRPRNSRSP